MSDVLKRIEENVSSVFRGKPEVVRLSLTCLVAGGHLLLEDVPGVGKTTLARALARSVELDLNRVQFTSDLLPSDIVGVSIYEDSGEQFVFHKGPIFANFVLADEINRASPRTQSALLEAMYEQQVTVDNTTHPLPDPHFVIATQNPFEYHGTYPLPESQLDRFMMRLSIGHASREVERGLLLERDRRDPVDALEAVATAAELKEASAKADAVHVDESLADYLMEIVQQTREHAAIQVGASTRAALTTIRAAKAHAHVAGRDFVVPDDIQEVIIASMAHRVRLGGAARRNSRLDAERTLQDIVDAIAVPA